MTANEKGNRVALVTGAATGIGLACAEAFARSGYTTVLADVNEPKEQAEALTAEGYKAVAYRVDVADTQAVQQMIDWIVAEYGHLDAAHNNAGIQTPQRPMAEITDEEFDRTVAVDLKGVWNCMRYEIRRTGCVHCLQACRAGAGEDCRHRLRRTQPAHQRRVPGCHSNGDGRLADSPQSGTGAGVHERHPCREARKARRDSRGGVVAVQPAGLVHERARPDCGRRHHLPMTRNNEQTP